MDPLDGNLSSSNADGRSDEELVDCFQSGDLSAYEELFHRYSSKMSRFASSFRVGDYADDIAQNALVRAYYTLPSIGKVRSFKAWIYRITRNLVIDHLRHVKLITWLPWNAQEESDTLMEIPLEQSEQQIEEATLLANAWAQVSQKYHACLYLDLVKGMKQQEIADELAMSISTVRRYIYRGKEELRKAWLSLKTDEVEEH